MPRPYHFGTSGGDHLSRHIALTVDRDSRLPLALQIRDSLRALIENGTLKPGTRIPSTRQLAADMRVSRSVVVEAYDQLAAEGYLAGRRGSGTSVTGRSGDKAAASVLTPPEEPAPGARWDLRAGPSDTVHFPRAEWLRCATAVIGGAGRQELGYAPLAGVPHARHVLTGYLGRVRGVRGRAEDLMITSGFAQGLALICRVLLDRGHTTLAVEDPGHPGEREFIAQSGLRPVGVPVDDDGLDVERLAACGARAVLITPAHQFPTGVRLSRERREALVAWARGIGGYVLEDDFDNGFLDPADRPPALQNLAPDRVVYAGSASKTLAPALRLGWLAGPPELMASVEHVRAGWDIGCSGLEQLTFARFVDTGAFDRHQRRLRTELGRRRRTLRAQLDTQLPEAWVRGGDGGLQAYVRLPPHIDEQALVRAARRRSVLLRGGRDYAVSPAAGPPALVIGYAKANCAALTRGLTEVGAVYREFA
ncbi:MULTISPECIES: PLP-dependent aminotransferase family protein [Streptomyces]|uniref:PLP-dependent aminotransferase family protein n=1 Tax=Streptomyces edwardsiae TaxID=3075527 RepID=A0ABU2PP18_9ACTN|nr:PLP-dependent aminotransferase family protein [Streptomyces sp. DSM 41636]MDT0393917.1 PLP-dependent aminotransferase family protein [Streptomyces sp. DSM 41636]